MPTRRRRRISVGPRTSWTRSASCPWCPSRARFSASTVGCGESWGDPPGPVARTGPGSRSFDGVCVGRHGHVVVGARGDGVLVTLAGRDDLVLRLDASDPGRALDALARLEVFVDLEKVLDLQAVEFAH